MASPSPISDLEPCGPSLEYDHEFAVLLARLVPRADAQYGSFVGTPEVTNWAEIERDCQRLLLRTKDINLLVWLCRARTRLAQSAGLVQVLSGMSAVLHAWPEAVHPQLVIEGEVEPSVRANALAALADPDGLLGDIWDIAVSTSTALRLTVRDVERALAIPRQPEALTPESVLLQLAALREAAQLGAASSKPPAPIDSLAQAAGHVRAINSWAKSQLGDEAPSLQALMRVLDLFVPATGVLLAKPESLQGPTNDEQESPQHQHQHQHFAVGLEKMPENIKLPTAAALTATRSRAEVLLTLRNAREWFEAHEPSSPVAVLLKQAERMVGKRFSQVADSIPLDLLQKWEAEEDSELAP